jgi:hypothetical protein
VHSLQFLDTPIENPTFPKDISSSASTCKLVADPGKVGLTEYIFRVKTLPAIPQNSPDKGDDAGTEGLIRVKLHGHNHGIHTCSNWINLKRGFPAGRSYELGLLGPDVGRVEQIDIKNDSSDKWHPDVLVMKRVDFKEPWSQFLLGPKPIGQETASFFPMMTKEPPTVVDTTTGLLKLRTQ